MFVSIHQNHALFQTDYDDKHYLLQLFRGIAPAPLSFNGPIDFMATGLMQRGKPDCWHIDLPLSLSTDEATPFQINGSFIGANHGFSAGVKVTSQGHGIGVNAVGTVWKDEAGISFTLLRVENPDQLLFLSQNIGKSETEYAFVKKITGALTQASSGTLLAFSEQRTVDMLRTIRPIKKQIYAWIEGKKQPVYDSAKCDGAELYEEYEIVNPASMLLDLQKSRPIEGYTQNPDLAQFGKAMALYSVAYRILSDGTVLCCFDHKKLQNIRIGEYLGAMFQEKIDAFGGGVRRYIPKTKPIDEAENTFDFSTPYPLYGKAFPNHKFITPEYFTTPDSPPDRIVDYLFDGDGNAKMGFACGFLPLYNGQPNIRKKQLIEAALLVRTRKAYPTFASGNLGDLKGIAYKKYFPVTSNNASWYTVQAEGKTYLYTDFFAPETLSIPTVKSATLLEKSDGVEYTQGEDGLTVTAKKGYAVFIIE